MPTIDEIIDEKIARANNNIERIDAMLLRLDALEARIAAREAAEAVQPPAPVPVPPPIIVTPPAVAPPPAPGNYSHTIIPNMTHRTLHIDRSSTLVNLAGQLLAELDIVIAVGVSDICIRGGTARSITSQIPGGRTPCYNRLLIENVTLNNFNESAMELHGNNTTLRNVTANSSRYCLWLGESEDLTGVLLEDCNFTSRGDESTVRITDCTDVQIKSTMLRNGNKHCLRLHGRTSNVTLEQVHMHGAGNGFAAGALQGVPASVSSVVVRDCVIATLGPDRLNLARDGSLERLRITSLRIATRTDWDIVAEYVDSHPASWDVSGLEYL
jgi:hypothetical protein